MVGKYKVITLCGSTRFKDAFMETQKRLTLEGNIVISVGLFGHSGDDEVWNEGTKEMLDAGYGGRFRKWLFSEDRNPYNSYGNSFLDEPLKDVLIRWKKFVPHQFPG